MSSKNDELGGIPIDAALECTLLAHSSRNEERLLRFVAGRKDLSVG